MTPVFRQAPIAQHHVDRRPERLDAEATVDDFLHARVHQVGDEGVVTVPAEQAVATAVTRDAIVAGTALQRVGARVAWRGAPALVAPQPGRQCVAMAA